jgi:thymidylate kinase
VNALARALEQAGVRYCILHDWELVSDPPLSDIDIAVAPEDLARLAQVLRRLEGKQVAQLFQHEATCFYFVMVGETPEGSPTLSPVDVLTDYRRYGVVFLTTDELLRDRWRWRDFWVASPRTEFQYLLIKKIGKGAMPPRQRSRLQFLLGELRGEERALARRLLGPSWGDRVVEWIRRGDWDAFELSLPRLSRSLRWAAVRRGPLRALRALAAEAGRSVLRVRSPSGLLVAVVGADGSGKSTLISHLERDLSRRIFRGTRRFHFRPGILGRTRRSGPVVDPHAQAPRSRLASLLKLAHYAADVSLGYVWLIRPLLVRSTLVLFDRYCHDLLVDPRRYRYGGPASLARLVARAVPAPDLILVLDVPADQIARRKAEVSEHEMRRQAQMYRRLASEFANVVVLDGTRGEREVAAEAEWAVVQWLHQRYLRRAPLAWRGWRQDDPKAWLDRLLRLEAAEPR